jgi:prepilin-type N-terminal cleavage/methylation domain-containing protein
LILKTIKDKGFALIELVTAIAITSIALGAIFLTFHYGLRQVKSVYHFSLANSIAQTEIEIIRSTPFLQLANRKEASFIGEARGLKELKNAEGKLTIEDYEGWVGKIKKVTVCVSWVEAEGRKREVKLTTLISRERPPNR